MKSMRMLDHQDKTAEALFGRSASVSIFNLECVKCGESAREFKDEVSKKEYHISALCQECQDGIFG
jgi:Zn ribbon nucleic-acid-binding protein